MIDPRRAMGLLKALRFAKENLKDGLKDDHAHWHDTPYHTEDAAAYDSFEADYGLPQGIDPNLSPAIVFPPPAEHNPMGAPPLSRFGDRVGESLGGPQLPDSGNCGVQGCAPLIPEIPPPVVRDYMAEAEAAMFECTPEDIELHEILKEQGYKAMESRGREHQRAADRKRQRKLFRANYARYVAEARLKNIQRAAEKLLKERLAAEKAAAQTDTAMAQPLPSPLDEATASAAIKKPPAPIDQGSLEAAQPQKEEVIA